MAIYKCRDCGQLESRAPGMERFGCSHCGGALEALETCSGCRRQVPHREIARGLCADCRQRADAQWEKAQKERSARR